MTTLDQALAQMRAMGMPDFPPGHPRLNTDKIIRYGPKGRAWYRLYEYTGRTGRSYITGSFGLWGMVEATKIEPNFEGMDPMERARIEQAQRDQADTERKKRVQKAKFAAARARAQWEGARSAPPSGVETYLDRKGVKNTKGLRWMADGTLLVPMVRFDVTEEKEGAEGYAGPWRMSGLQKIAPDGQKRFSSGMFKEGVACRLGPAVKGGGLFFVTEGLATGLSLLEATEGKFPVYVVFDAGNLMPAAKILRALFPVSTMVFCADDDAYLVSSFNKLLRENFHVTEILQPPLSNAHVAGELRSGDRWLPAGLVVNAEWSVDYWNQTGLYGAVTAGDRNYTIVRENTGRKKAQEAAAAVSNASVIHPVFRDRKLPPEPDCAKLTDFNDLHQAEGLDAVRAQLQNELKNAELAAAIRKALADERKTGKPGKKSHKGHEGAGGDGAGGKDDPPRAFDWTGFFSRFTLIYPTDTLWDAKLGELVKLNNVKIAFGKRPVEYWLDDPKRRTIDLCNLVFEPGKDVGEGFINLFRGMPSRPKSGGDCSKLLRLIQYLCGEEGQDQAPVTEWVLRWLAYPLKHPGAKMRTAIVMHGPEGTGKNLFFGAIKDIYGEYGSLITQTELEDRFNGWLSRRLFLIANEVISRAEMRHHVGRLKNMVTEDVLPIRDMWAPLRYESNHANMIFLTNEIQAMQIMPGDRRYQVIKTPGVLSQDFYIEVAEELRAGGVEALHAYLLNLDLGDFSEHTKPLMTAAKEDLIEIGLNSTQFFWQQLHDGLLFPMEYRSCLVTDAYKAYQIFCARTGERNARPLNKWVHEFVAMNGVSRAVRDIDNPDSPVSAVLNDGAKRRQASVFIMGEIPLDVQNDRERLTAFIKKSVVEFREQLRKYQDDDMFRRRGAREDDGQPPWAGDGS